MASGALLLLLLTALSAVTGWDSGTAVFATAFFVIGFGVAPALSARSASSTTLFLTALATSMSVAILGGLLMARTSVWHPVGAFVGLGAVSAGWLLVHLRRDLAALRGTSSFRLGGPRDRVQWASTILAVGGLVLVLLDAFVHRQAPTPGGLLTIVGVTWYVGLALMLAAALLATLTRRNPGVAILALTLPIVASQAIAYGAPTVMSATRHVGIVEYIRAYHLLHPDFDIYQAWAGLFSGVAWLCDVAGIDDPVTTVATYWPLVLNVATALAVRVLAGNLGIPRQRAWWAAGAFVFVNSLNVTYFSPQSLALFLALAVLALSLRVSGSRGWALAGHVTVIVVLSSAIAVTHQISPYLLVLALAVLVAFRLVGPWWPIVAVLVPALIWAGVNAAQVSAYVAPSAVGNVIDNVRPPSLSYNSFDQALVTRLTFGLPALVLALVGVVALVSWFQHRDRRSWALIVAAASPAAMALGSDYGQEAIFRIALFSLPWLCLSAGLVHISPRLAVPALVGGAVVLCGVNAYGLTGMDWARVVRADEATQVRNLERSTEGRPVLYTLGTGAADPGRMTERYLSVDYGVVDYYSAYSVLHPAPGTQQEADKEMAALTASLAPNCPSGCYLVVSQSAAAYTDRYGIQRIQDYRRYAESLATSPDWQVYSTGPTSTIYRLVAPSGQGGG